MAKKKHYRGHFCKICGAIKPNEKFSGKGHKNHICKSCSKLPQEKKNEMLRIRKNESSMYKSIQAFTESTRFEDEIDEDNIDWNDDDALPF